MERIGTGLVEIKENLFLPLVGLGTWLLKGSLCTRTVQAALELGYRHFDTAHYYENHTAIGKGIKGFDRKEIFLTSKFYLEQLDQESLEEGCDRALSELKSDYLDLYLLHYPDRSLNMIAALKAAEKLILKQKVLSIGVSNCTIHHLQDMLNQGISISVNQVEFHPYLNQQELFQFCKQHQIHLTSFRSLGKGGLIADPLLNQISKKYNKTAAQIILRWLIEQNISVIPKASSKNHLKENLDLFDFSLTSEDRAILDQLNPERRFCCGDWTDFNY